MEARERQVPAQTRWEQVSVPNLRAGVPRARGCPSHQAARVTPHPPPSRPFPQLLPMLGKGKGLWREEKGLFALFSRLRGWGPSPLLCVSDSPPEEEQVDILLEFSP